MPRSTPLGPGPAAACLLATGFGSGSSPVAPGTAGSLVGLALFWPLRLLGEPACLGALALLFGTGVIVSGHEARRAGVEDPGRVVVDEMVGMWATLLWLPWSLGTAIAGFLLFRAMDVLKPYPARQLEGLPRGWGIMADDVMAGIYANLLLRVGLLVWPV